MIFFDPEKIAVTVNGPYEAARTAIVDESLQRSAAITLLELSSLHDKDQTEPDADKCIDNIKAVVTDRVYDDPRLFEQLLLSAVEPFKDFMGDLKDHAEEAEPEDTV